MGRGSRWDPPGSGPRWMGSPVLLLCRHCLWRYRSAIGRPYFPSAPASGQLFIAVFLAAERRSRKEGLESGTSVLTASEKPRKVNDTARRRVFPENRRERNRASLGGCSKGRVGEEDAESDRAGLTSLYRFPALFGAGYCTAALAHAATPMAGTGRRRGSRCGHALVRFCRMFLCTAAASVHVTGLLLL